MLVLHFDIVFDRRVGDSVGLGTKAVNLDIVTFVSRGIFWGSRRRRGYGGHFDGGRGRRRDVRRDSHFNDFTFTCTSFFNG